MRRIESTQVPGETRKMLRERLARFLPVDRTPRINVSLAVFPPTSDQELLALYLGLSLAHGCDVTRLRSFYLAEITPTTPEGILPPSTGSGTESGEADEAQPTVDRPSGHDTTAQPSPPPTPTTFADSPSLDGLSPAPTFDELVERGWVTVSWGRASVPRDIAFAVRRSDESTTSPFGKLVQEANRTAFELLDGYSPSGQLTDLATAMLAGSLQPSEISCISPAWIAARLWDSYVPTDFGADDMQQRIGRWIDWWEAMNGPSFAMSHFVQSASLSEFVEGALAILAAPTTSPDWRDFAKRAATPGALLYPHRATALADSVNAIPQTILGRIRWMEGGEPERTFFECLQTRAASLLAVILNEAQDAEWDTTGLAPRLMELVVTRPALLMQVVQRARRAPALLADMLMAPSTCALACGIIAGWQFNGGGWNRSFQAHADQTTELLAFEDALAILGGHVDTDSLPATDLASLYVHVYELASHPQQATRCQALLSLLRQELTSAPSRIQDSIGKGLISLAKNPASATVAFCAALDLACEAGTVERIAANDLTSLYLDVLLPEGVTLALRQLDAGRAQAFVSVALRGDDRLRNRFLNAVDVSMWASLVPMDQDSIYTNRDLFSRRIQLHIRVLSRAIAGWPGTVPDDVVDALARSIRAGSTNDIDRGKVDAFTPGFGFHLWRNDEHPIALDIAAALRRTNERARQRLLTELCRLEEPIVLAGLVANTPASINVQLRSHLSTLTPDTSSQVFNLPAMQARVDALLTAGLQDVAADFIAAERAAITFGPTPGREVSVLRAELRMLLLREDWDAITSHPLPEGINEATRREANDVLLFYRGVAELKKEPPNPTASESIFLQLTERDRKVPAYALNLFASRVQRLLSTDGFATLSGEPLTLARRYLIEAERDVRSLVANSPSNLKSFESNRIMLLLATGQHREALQAAMAIRETEVDAHIEGFRALSLARTGSRREALAALTDAEGVFGRTDFLSAIRANIENHRPYLTAPSLAIDDDPVPGIRQAFDVFTRLGHVEQAEVLQSRGRLDLYLQEEVRGACASVVALAPMMKGLGLLGKEDDISGVLKQLLRSRLLLTQWSVEDQSRGGFSRTGGVGERDILVSKGTLTLAVAEALLVDSVETVNLTSHFQKLLGYDTCRIFFHITYVRRGSCARIVSHLKTTCRMPPGGITFVNSEDLPDADSAPVGFGARYEIDSRAALVVFLVLDLSQPIQRAAAQSQ